jgi:hypothetical protein
LFSSLLEHLYEARSQDTLCGGVHLLV